MRDRFSLLLPFKHCRTAVLSSESVTCKSFGWHFNKHPLFSEQATTVIFVRVSWRSNVISMDIAVCSCRSKTNIKSTSRSRTRSRMERPWEFSSLSGHPSYPQLSFGKSSQEATFCFLGWWCLPDVERGFWTFQDGKTGGRQISWKGDLLLHNSCWISDSPRCRKWVPWEKSFGLLLLHYDIDTNFV